MLFILYVLKVSENLAPYRCIYTHMHTQSGIFAEFCTDQILDFKMLSNMKEIMKVIFASNFVFTLFCKKSEAV